MAKKKHRTTPELVHIFDEALAKGIEEKAAGPKRPPPKSIRELEFVFAEPETTDERVWSTEANRGSSKNNES